MDIKIISYHVYLASICAAAWPGGRVGRGGDAGGPCEPVRDGVVGVVEVEVVLGAGQTVRELDRVFDLRRREGRVGRGVAVRGPAATIQCANLTKIKQQEKIFRCLRKIFPQRVQWVATTRLIVNGCNNDAMAHPAA